MRSIGLIVAALALAGCGGDTGFLTTATSPDPQRSAVGAVLESDIVSENELPGDASWRRARSAGENPDSLSAYTSSPSAYPGDVVGVHVSTTASSYRIKAYRMGHYGGKQARLVWTSDQHEGEDQSTRRGYKPALRMPYAKWQRSVSIDTTDWPGGMYLLRVVGSNDAEWLVPLVLRDRVVDGKVMLVIPDTTSQAYNLWGGRSAYSGPGGFADRSRAVSYSRPYLEGSGAGRYLFLAHPVVALAEREGIPLTYVNASDLDVESGVMQSTEGVVMLGHDEYWTPRRRAETEAARDRGVDLAFLGANTMYWRTRVVPGPEQQLQMTIYKDASEDPVQGRRTTARFRDPPDGEAERSLIGMDYECYPAKGTFVVSDPDFFLFRGSGLRQGQRLDGIVDIEVDRAYPLPGTPSNLRIVANSPTDCGGVMSVANTTYYSTESGAGVFATGSIGWITRAMRTFAPGDARNSPRESKRFVRSTTTRLLESMAAGPMGKRFPAVGNIDDFELLPRNITGKA